MRVNPWLCALLLTCLAPQCAPLGVTTVTAPHAKCLWLASYFDLVLESDNVYSPFWMSHLANSVRIPSTEEVISSLKHCHASKRVLLVSPEGADSLALANRLADDGMKNVFNLEGGLDAWKLAQGATQGGPCCVPPGLSCEASSGVDDKRASEIWEGCAGSGTSLAAAPTGGDLQIQWARAFGSGGSLAADVGTMGSMIGVVGTMEGECSFDTRSDRATVASHGGTDAFVMFVDNRLGDVVWAVAIGGTGDDAAVGVAMCPRGGVYVLGEMGGGEGMLGVDREKVPVREKGRTDPDVFVAHLDGKGRPQWIISLGGRGVDTAGGLVFADNHVYATGVYRGGMNTLGGVEVAALGGSDVFVAKIEVQTGRVAALGRAGGLGQEGRARISVSSNGDVLAVGFSTRGAVGTMTGLGDGKLWMQGSRACQEVGQKGACLWVAAVGADKLSLVWAKAFPFKCSAGRRCGVNVTSVASATDGTKGAIIVSGSFVGDAAGGWSSLRSAGRAADGFVVKLTESTGDVIWSKRFGGNERDIISSTAASGPGGRLMMTGEVLGNVSVATNVHETLADESTWRGRYGGTESPSEHPHLFLGQLSETTGKVGWILNTIDAVGSGMVSGVGMAASEQGFVMLGNMDVLSVRMGGILVGDGQEGGDGHLAGKDRRQIILGSIHVSGMGGTESGRVYGILFLSVVAITGCFVCCSRQGLLRQALERMDLKPWLARRHKPNKRGYGKLGKKGKRGMLGSESEMKVRLEAVREELSDELSDPDGDDADTDWGVDEVEMGVLTCTSPRVDDINLELDDVDPALDSPVPKTPVQS